MGQNLVTHFQIASGLTSSGSVTAKSVPTCLLVTQNTALRFALLNSNQRQILYGSNERGVAMLKPRYVT